MARADPAKPLRSLLLVLVGICLGGVLVSLRRQDGPTASMTQRASEYRPTPPQNISLAVQLPAWAGCRHPPCKYSDLTDGGVDSTVKWSSQFGEDRWVANNLFHKKRNGVFLEMGANDGILFSNTLWLAKAAGWKGLLIEANPALFPNLARNRRESICVNAAICSSFRTVHWHNADASMHLGSLVGAIVEFMSDTFREKFHPNITADQLIELPCVPLQFILDKFGFNHIDFWSLDVEGAELDILQSVDFSRLTVDVIVVETDGTKPDKDAAVKALLTDAGFKAVDHGPDNRPEHEKKEYIGAAMSNMDTVFIHKRMQGKLWSAPDITTLQL